MSKAYKCDRCGSVFSTRDVGVTIGVLNACCPTTVRTKPVGESKFYGRKYQLCANCSTGLYAYLRDENRNV